MAVFNRFLLRLLSAESTMEFFKSLLEGRLKCLWLTWSEENPLDPAFVLVQDDVLLKICPVQLQSWTETTQVKLSLGHEFSHVGWSYVHSLDRLERYCDHPEVRIKLNTIVINPVLLPQAFHR